MPLWAALQDDTQHEKEDENNDEDKPRDVKDNEGIDRPFKADDL